MKPLQLHIGCNSKYILISESETHKNSLVYDLNHLSCKNEHNVGLSVKEEVIQFRNPVTMIIIEFCDGDISFDSGCEMDTPSHVLKNELYLILGSECVFSIDFEIQFFVDLAWSK